MNRRRVAAHHEIACGRASASIICASDGSAAAAAPPALAGTPSASRRVSVSAIRCSLASRRGIAAVTTSASSSMPGASVAPRSLGWAREIATTHETDELALGRREDGGACAAPP
jgi:hypothetical protein